MLVQIKWRLQKTAFAIFFAKPYFSGYGKCPKILILYAKVSDNLAYANTADPDQTGLEGAV